MNVVNPRLPRGARELFNALYPTKEPQYLTDDLYAAQLPGGVSINVGWFPEGDPSGAYEICVYRGTFENQILPPIEVRDLEKVVDIITQLGKVFGGQAPMRSASINSHIEAQQGEIRIVGDSAIKTVRLDTAEPCHA